MQVQLALLSVYACLAISKQIDHKTYVVLLEENFKELERLAYERSRCNPADLTNNPIQINTTTIGKASEGRNNIGNGTGDLNQTNCECVHPRQCKPIGRVVNKSTKLKCQKQEAVCCKKSHIISSSKPVNYQGCGKRNPNGIGPKIQEHKDNKTQFGEFPWMVAVMSKDEMLSTPETDFTYKCGGSLIHPKAVLTAAHCVRRRPARTLRVRAGEHDMQSTSEAIPHQDRNVATVIIHEGYKVATVYNDYAILILSNEVNLTQAVDVICLPERNMQFDHSRCIVTGWGKDDYEGDWRYHSTLKRVDLPIVDSKTCSSSINKLRPKFGKLHGSFICAGGEAGTDSCNGEGGTPLVCPMKNDPHRYYQAGVGSWGVGCGIKNVPVMYANVAKARNWIDTQLKKNNLHNSYYVHHPG